MTATCEEHGCAIIPDADEDGRCDYCPECEARRNRPLYFYDCAAGCGRTMGTWVKRDPAPVCFVCSRAKVQVAPNPKVKT